MTHQAFDFDARLESPRMKIAKRLNGLETIHVWHIIVRLDIMTSPACTTAIADKPGMPSLMTQKKARNVENQTCKQKDETNSCR